MTYAIHDLYTAYTDPEDLVSIKPKPLVYTRHEVPLRDLHSQIPEIPSTS